jgi:hypothetical protein
MYNLIRWLGICAALGILALHPWGLGRAADLPGINPPTDISCIVVKIDGEEIVRQLPRPIPVERQGEIRSAFVRLGQEFSLFGATDVQKSRGARIVLEATSQKMTVEIGRVCYVMMNYCGQNCYGQGCESIIIRSIK